MIERVAATGGTLDAGPADPGVWRVRASLPLMQPAKGLAA